MIRAPVVFIIILIIWVLNGKYLYEGFREKIWSEFFIHTGMGLFFTVLVSGLALPSIGIWKNASIGWLQVIGFVLYIPSIYLVLTSMHMLKSSGKPIGFDRYGTTKFVDKGIYGIIRQPMTLGMAIWSLALILLFQSFSLWSSV